MQAPNGEQDGTGDQGAVTFTEAEQKIIASDPQLAQWASSRTEDYLFNFVPRPDDPANFDEQHGFVYNQDTVSFAIGGNAAGTTESSAFKCAEFLLRQQPPPRANTPFWIISNTFEQVCGVCWDEKLFGHGHIPECEIDWPNVRWLSKKDGWPASVPLKPWPGRPGKNWKIEFKSYEQGRRALQARSIGGFWFSEQFPLSLFLETLRGCREYMFPGGQFCEFTPIEPDLCLWVEKVMDEPPPGWAFYRQNTAANVTNLAEGWFEQFFASVPDEMIQTRMTGALATFEGVIFQAFNPAVHVIDEEIIMPPGVRHFRGIDWGASTEHPFTCVWGYVDGAGDWYVYDEYWNIDQSRITMDHVEEINSRWPWPYDQSGFGPAFADPSRPGEINEFNQRGLITYPAGNDVFKGIDCIRSLLKLQPNTGKPKILINGRNCPHLIEEMRKYRWKRGRRPTEGAFLNPAVPVAAPLKRDDDTVDALRYMIYSAVRLETGTPPNSASYADFEKRKGIQVNERLRHAEGRGPRTMVLSNKPGWFDR